MAEIYRAKSISATLNNNAFQLRIRTQFAGEKKVNFEKPGRIAGRFVEVKQTERVRTGASRELDAEYKRLKISDKHRNELESAMDIEAVNIRDSVLKGGSKKKAIEDCLLSKRYAGKNEIKLIGYICLYYPGNVSEVRTRLKNEGKL